MAKPARSQARSPSRKQKRDRFLDEVATRIAEHRRLRGMTQLDLAKAARLSLDAVNKIEVGSRFPNLGTLFDLAQALGMNVADLVANDRARQTEVDQLAAFLGHQPSIVVTAVATCTRAIASLVETPKDR